MISSGFFDAKLVTAPDNSTSYDRAYLASEFAKYFSLLIGNGVFMRESTNLQLMAKDTPDMSVILKAGYGWINGYWVCNDEDMSYPISVADSVLKRKDIVVAGLKFADRAIAVYVKQGIASASPVAPILQRDADVYELQLAEIEVNSGIVSITNSLISDTRLDTDLCGIVHALIDHIDTTTLYNQILSDLAGFKSVNEADFTSWSNAQKVAYNELLASIQGILSGDVAGNLLNLIQNHTADTTVHIQAGERTLWNGKSSMSTPVPATLLAANWTGSSAPYSIDVAVSGITATNYYEIRKASSATFDQRAMINAANIGEGSQSVGHVILVADGDKPTLDLPVEFIIRGDL